MKVQDLIDRLNQFDPELEVVVQTDNGFCYDIWGSGKLGFCDSGVFTDEDTCKEESIKINVVKLDVTT
jgi:hypothetical protein